MIKTRILYFLFIELNQVQLIIDSMFVDKLENESWRVCFLAFLSTYDRSLPLFRQIFYWFHVSTIEHRNLDNRQLKRNAFNVVWLYFKSNDKTRKRIIFDSIMFINTNRNLYHDSWLFLTENGERRSCFTSLRLIWRIKCCFSMECFIIN